MSATPIMVTFTSHSAAQTVALGRAVGAAARAGDLLALIGELGAGKTQFTRGVASALHIPASHVASPTYVLMHEYEPPDSALPVLVHIDAYRLTSLADLESVGYSHSHGGLVELRRNAIVLIEWADRLGGELGDDALIVRMAHRGENERSVEFTAPSAWADRIRKLIDETKARSV